MKSYRKFTSTFLVASLVVAPISGVVVHNDNVARAEQTVRKEIIISNDHFLKAAIDTYNEGLITKEQLEKLEKMLKKEVRVPGVTKVVYFHDALDLYISGPHLAMMAIVTNVAAVAILNAAIAYVLPVKYGVVVSTAVNFLVDMDFLTKENVSKIADSGIVIYMKYSDLGRVHHYRWQ